MQCYACDSSLKQVFGPDFQDPRQDPRQCVDAVEVNFSGGYGMLIDPNLLEGVPSALLCKSCVEKMCDDLPWMGRLLGPYFNPSKYPLETSK